MEIISKNKKYERFDWRAKLSSLDTNRARKWQYNEFRNCVEDKKYWFNQYVWIVDVEKQKIIPFMLWDYQSGLIDDLDFGQDLFIDKSRALGISWTIMGWETHRACYSKVFSALNISRKESEVQDTGNTYHALMGRVYFIWDRLPPFLKPKIHNPFLSFQVPSMNSVIRGESANKNAGRDTQYTFIFIDEAAHIAQLDEMWKAVRNSSNFICLNSTPPKEIANSKFAEIRDKKNSGFRKRSFHWKQRPDRDQEWYEKKTASMEEEEIAQELEIGYDKAQTNRSYPEYSDDIHLCKYKIYFNPLIQLNIFIDFGLGGEVFLFNQIDKDQRIFFIKYSIYKNMLTNELYIKLLEDLKSIGYTGDIEKINFIGDTAGSKRSRATKTSVIQDYSSVSDGKIRIRHQAISNYDKMLAMRKCLKTFVNGKPQFNISGESSSINFSHCMKYCSLNKNKDDHTDTKYTHGVNAAEYGIAWFFPYKKAEVCIVGSDQDPDDNEKINITVTGEEKESFKIPVPHAHYDGDNPELINKPGKHIEPGTTIGSMLLNNRINRRSLIWR